MKASYSKLFREALTFHHSFFHKNKVGCNNLNSFSSHPNTQFTGDCKASVGYI